MPTPSRSPTRMRREDSCRYIRSPSKTTESCNEKSRLWSRSPSHNDSSRSPTGMRRRHSYRYSRSPSKFTGHRYERQSLSTSSSRRYLSPSQAERKGPSGSDRKRSTLSKSKSPSLATTATTTNVLTLENVTEIKFQSANEMERYIQESNAQIISPNDCLNIQPVQTTEHSAYCAEPPVLLLSPLGKNGAPLICGDKIFDVVNGKYPSGDEVSDKLDQYLGKWDKELENVFAEPEEEVMDSDKLEFVLRIVMQRIKSLHCLLYLENFGKTSSFDHSIPRNLFDTMIGVFGDCHISRKDYYGQTVDFVTSKLDVIFTGGNATRKYIHDVSVPECFTFAVIDILNVSYDVAI